MRTIGLRRAVTYERVSSEDQKQRETIKTQQGELAVRLDSESDVSLRDRYVDDGVSGTIPMADRPAGKRLLEDAARGLFDEVWVWKLDRLGPTMWIRLSFGETWSALASRFTLQPRTYLTLSSTRFTSPSRPKSVEFSWQDRQQGRTGRLGRAGIAAALYLSGMWSKGRNSTPIWCPATRLSGSIGPVRT